MKKNLILQYTVVFLLLLSAKAQSQEYPIKQQVVVIAESGLNLRSEPNKNAKILVKMPYFSNVQIIGKDTYGIDTAEVIQSTGVNPQIVKGQWVKIKYQGYKGYALNSYLFTRSKRKLEAGINESYVLLMPGWGCNDNLVDKRKYNWYGAYGTDNGIKLKKVNFQYINDPTSMTYHGIIIKDKIEPRFIVGSIKKLEEEIYSGNSNIPMISYQLFQKEYTDTTIVFGKTIIFDSYQKDGEDPVNFTCIRQGNQEQILSTPKNEFGYLPRHLIWEGDLDGDGLIDYILQIGEKSAQTVLFLSSERKKGELVRAVASFYSGYCC